MVGDKLFINGRIYQNPATLIDPNFDSESHAQNVRISHAPAIFEQGNSFQGHFAHIQHQVQNEAVLLKLYEDKNIASATHNIWAYRVESPQPGQFLKKISDDGEFGAGYTLLEIMREHNIVNGMLITSRWYGGVHMGNRRFECVCDAAERVLRQIEAV